LLEIPGVATVKFCRLGEALKDVGVAHGLGDC
jgi:hypothetical protein